MITEDVSRQPGSPRTFRRSRADRLGILAIAVLLLAGCALPMLAALQVAQDALPFALFMAAIGLVLAFFTVLVLLEAWSRWRVEITMDSDSLRLRLPARRGYIRLAAVDRSLPLAAVLGVQTRGEAFRALGNTALQQTYALHLDDGSRIVLGGDRVWMAPLYGEVAAAIAEQIGRPVEDLGVVDGKAGNLMFWGQTVPPWDTLPLPAEVAERRRRDVEKIWQLVAVLFLILALIRLAVALFGD